MRTMITGLVSAGLLVAVASPSMAAQRDRNYARYNSPSAIAERQRHARTFDSAKYYERDLRKIPLGTQAWWDQYGREFGGDRR